MKLISALTIVAITTIHATSAKAATVYNSGPWKTECEIDRMTDKKKCSVTLSIGGQNGGKFFAGGITSYDMGKSWSVIGAPNVFVYQIRVGKGKAISSVCKSIFDCDIKGSKASLLVKGFSSGESILYSITTAVGSFDGEASSFGFKNAMEAAREWSKWR